MPYLMLDFVAERDAERTKNGDKKPLGKERIQFKMIDTDNGKVIEMSMVATNVEQVERQPQWGETHAAGQVLGKDPGTKVNKAEFDTLAAERDKYRQQAVSAEQQIRNFKLEQERLKRELEAAKKADFAPETKQMMAAALDVHIEELAMSQNLDGYAKAKTAYRQLTGRSWLGEDDDQEDD